ncbi:MAG: YitT family protein [Candidatus Kapaibacteriales bacterium]
MKYSTKVLYDYLFLTFGAFIMSIAIGVFLVDAYVVPGGVSGLSMAIYYLSDEKIPVGALMWILNVPLYFWGLKELGKKFAFRTFYAFTMNSFFVDLLRGEVYGFEFIRLQDLPSIKYLHTHDFLFTILIGAVLLGSGLGIIFRFKGTTAGSDIVAAIMNKKLGWKTGQAIMFIDFFVISFAGLIIHLKHLSDDAPALVLTLYAFFLLFISSKLIDIILDGFDYARMAIIIADKYQEIVDSILNDLGRGATALRSRGVYRNVEREVILTVVSVKEVEYLKEKVRQKDPDAFVVISNVYEIVGRGFRTRV